MAYHLYSSPSSLFCDRRSFCRPHCSSRKFQVRNFKLLLHSLPLSKTFLHVNCVSLKEPIIEEEEDDVDSKKEANFEDPDVRPASKSRSYAWVNPRSPRAVELQKKSYDCRYNSLVEIAESLNSCSRKEGDIFEILKVLGDKILEQDAVTILNNMLNSDNAPLVLEYFQKKVKPSREVILYNVTLKVCSKCRDFDGAEKLFGEMLKRGVKPDNVTFSTLINCARMSSLLNKAVEWFEKAFSFGCEPNDVTCSAMIDVYGRAGNLDMALSLYDRAKTEKWRIGIVAFGTLIKMLGMSGNYDGCLNVYEEMKAFGAKPNIFLYNTLLDAMGKAKRPWQAKTIYREMKRNGFSPNWATYASLLRAFCRSRYIEDALNVYKEMKEKGMDLNIVLYNTLLSMCAEVGCEDPAIKIFGDMKHSETCKPDSWTFSSLISIYSCSGKVSEAEAVFNEMIQSGIEPTIYVLTSLVQCYGKAKHTDDVVKTFNRLMDLGIVPDDHFCGCFLNVMTQTPKDEFGKLMECIEKANPRLGSVVKYLVEEPYKDKDLRDEVSDLFESIVPRVRKSFCNCLIDLCVNLNVMDRACELLDLGLTLEIYTDLQSRSQSQWSLHLKSLSLGAALTALQVWFDDLSKALESGEDLPPLIGITTGHGKHKFTDKGLAVELESHLKELNTPFNEDPDEAGWFFTTKEAVVSWLETRVSPEAASA